MKFILTLLLISTSSLFADFLDDIKKSGKAIVVYGERAPAKERRIAKDIYEALELDDVDDLYDHIITDKYCLRHQFFYSSFHLIIVGTAKSNQLCSINADLQYAGAAKNNSPINIFPASNNTGKSLFSSRYGYFPETSGVGYVRRILNPFTLKAFNLTDNKFKSQAWSATFITGEDSEGVMNAYTQMMDEKMLEGIIMPSEKVPAKSGRFHLGKDRVYNKLPKGINPVSFQSDKKSLDYKGWIMGSVSDYAGFKKISGVTAEQIVHLKYQGKALSLLSYDDQVNTLMCIKFKDEKESLTALKGIDKTMRLALDIKDSPALKVYPSSNGRYEYSIVRKGSWLIIENIQQGFKSDFASKADKLLKNDDK